MYPHICYVFIDGGYLRGLAQNWTSQALDPLKLPKGLVGSLEVQTWAYDPMKSQNAFLGWIIYYDALPDDESERSAELEEYWKAIEVLNDVHLGFGALKCLKRKVRHKDYSAPLSIP